MPPKRTADAAGLLAAVRWFVAEEVLPKVDVWDREDRLPDHVQRQLLDLGLAGALVPAEYGGPGYSVLDMVPIWRTLSQGWISLTGAVNPSGLATALLTRHGSEAQRQRWLPQLGAGEIVAAFSITEPQAGSDLRRLETEAAPAPLGGLRLSGTKRWVAGGASAEVIFMLVLLEGFDKPSCVILPATGRGDAGWRVENLDKVGYRGVESAQYTFADFVAAEAEILGGPDRAGHGTAQMLDALDVGRINVACRALGILDRIAATAAAEALERAIGDGVLGDHTHTQLRIGEMHVRMLAAESLTRRAAAAVDAGADDARALSTAAKVFASDTAVAAIEPAARLAASRSYSASDELARLRRDAPQTQIGEGANDALLFALARDVLRDWEPAPAPWRGQRIPDGL